MAKIESLTEEQEALLPVWREEWRAIGLSTERIDQREAKASIRALYQAAGLTEPKTVIVAQSPMQALLMRSVLRSDQLRGQLRGQLGGRLRGQLGGRLMSQLRGQLGDQLRGQLVDQLRGQLVDQLRGRLMSQLRGQLGDQLRGQLRGQLVDQLWGQLGGQLGDQLRGQLRGQLVDQLWGQLVDQLWGQLWGQLGELYQSPWTIGSLDAYWLSFYDAAKRIGVCYPPNVDAHFVAYQQYAKTCGIAYCYESVAFVCDRPTTILLDDQSRLHSSDGYALEWTDGFGVCAWHGVRVPRWIFDEPTKLTPAAIRSETNVEISRSMIEVYDYRHGDGAFLINGGADLVHEDEWGKLWRAQVGEDEPYLAVEVVNSTAEPDGHHKRYFLQVHPELRPIPDPMDGESDYGPAQEMTALNAVASTFGMTGEQYRVYAES